MQYLGLDFLPTSQSLVVLLAIALGVVALVYIWQAPITPKSRSHDMSPLLSSSASKSQNNALIAEIKDITGATQADAAKLVKKHKTLEGAIDAFYNDPTMQAHAMSGSGDRQREKKLGEVWERFKDPTDPKLIKIDGTMQLCEELGIDPSSDSVLFCLAHDLGSKVTGEWEKGSWVSGWAAMPGNIDSIIGMKNRLPGLRNQLNSDPAYFKKVYMHTFDLAKAQGSRTLALDSALDLWTLYIPPALSSRPSALSRVVTPNASVATTSSTSDPPQFTNDDFDTWIEFQRKKGKAVSKDTWSLFVDFIRSIDGDFKEYDEEAAWPSGIDDFVDHVRTRRGSL